MNGTIAHAMVDLFRGEQRRPSLILLSSVMLIALWRTIGSQQFYLDHLSDRFAALGHPQAAAAFYHIGMCGLLLGVIPLIIVRCVLREKLADYGLKPGEWRRGLLLFAAAAPVIWLLTYLSASDEAFRAEYPLNRQAGSSPGMFLTHALSLAAFYFGWEFHFRGYLQHGLAGSMGKQNSMWVQVMASCLAHLGKPTTELFSSIPAGVFWGMQAYRTQSLLAGFLQHWLLGVLLDYFIVYGG